MPLAYALRRVDPIWKELFPVEQHRMVQLLIGKVDVSKDDVHISLRSEGFDTLACELRDIDKPKGMSVVTIPMVVKKRGGRKLIIAPPGMEDVVDTRIVLVAGIVVVTGILKIIHLFIWMYEMYLTQLPIGHNDDQNPNLSLSKKSFICLSRLVPKS